MNVENQNQTATPDILNNDADAGVKKIEAITLTWSRTELNIAYGWCVLGQKSGENVINFLLIYDSVFLIFFLMSLQQQIHNNVVSYVTSGFALLPLTGTTSIFSSTIGGVFRLPTGKFIDIIGRNEGLIIMTIFTTTGMKLSPSLHPPFDRQLVTKSKGIAMMAATKSFQTFAAAQVFYWIGFDGMGYVMDVFMADTSSPKNRALVFAFSTAPYILTTFIGPWAAANYLRTSDWPWAYGTFVVLTPLATFPLLYVLFRNERKAHGLGILLRQKTNRSLSQTIFHYLLEFDVVGLILICAAFILTLLPLTLASYQDKKWSSPIIITMMIIGVTCFITFFIWEKILAPVSFIPFKLLQRPSIWGPCLLAMFLFISFYLWNSNFLPFLQAVHGLSVTDAGYISNVYSIGSCTWALGFAGIIRITGRFKYLAMGHLCILVLGVGLMVNFCQPSSHIGYVILCQIFIAFASGGLVISEQMAIMAACANQTVAIPLALIALFSSVGGAIGAAISGAIFTNKFPDALDRALPGNKTLNSLLYGNLETQLNYPFGTSERDAILFAYGETMWFQTCAAVAFLTPCFLFIAFWENFKVEELETADAVVL